VRAGLYRGDQRLTLPDGANAIDLGPISVAS
jgi:hypothetical protein